MAESACRFDCAFATGAVGRPDGDLHELIIAGGRYACLEMVGDFDRIHPEIDALYQWALAHEEEVDDQPLFIHYLDDPDEVQPESQRATIYLPLAQGSEI